MFKSLKNIKSSLDEYSEFEKDVNKYGAGTLLVSVLTLCLQLLSQQLYQIRYGANILVFAAEAALGAILTAAGLVWFHFLNKKKYDLVKDLGIVTFKRARVFDEIMHACGFVLSWCYIYLPLLLDKSLTEGDPRFLFVLPIIPPILWALFSLPFLLTNSKIVKDTGIREKTRKIKKKE